VSFIGFLILLALVLTAVFAPLVAPFDPAAQSLRARLLPPFWLPRGTVAHLLGTDYLGRDVLSRLIYGSRASLGIGVSVVALAGSFGVVMGLVAGYLGGRTDSVIMRVIDTQIAFPGLLLALIILATIGPTPATVIVVLALNGWMVYARMTRGIVLSLRQMPFVEAAEMIGCRPRRVVFRHLLPNLTSPLLTLMMLEFARVVAGGSFPVVPRPGGSAAGKLLGARCRDREGVHLQCVVARHLPGLCDCAHRAGNQPGCQLGSGDIGSAGA
jgi:peptide/nickel transport system permease protein